MFLFPLTLSNLLSPLYQYSFYLPSPLSKLIISKGEQTEYLLIIWNLLNTRLVTFHLKYGYDNRFLSSIDLPLLPSPSLPLFLCKTMPGFSFFVVLHSPSTLTPLSLFVKKHKTLKLFFQSVFLKEFSLMASRREVLTSSLVCSLFRKITLPIIEQHYHFRYSLSHFLENNTSNFVSLPMLLQLSPSPSLPPLSPSPHSTIMCCDHFLGVCIWNSPHLLLSNFY
jgi:hypothetical protein